MSFDNENEIFYVVKNHEDQHSIWPTWKEIPNGWDKVGKEGNKEECLAYIEEHWTDITPRSLKEAMAANSQ